MIFSKTVSLSGTAALIKSKQTLAFCVCVTSLFASALSPVSRPCLSSWKKCFWNLKLWIQRILRILSIFKVNWQQWTVKKGCALVFSVLWKEILKFPMIVVIRHLKIEVKSSLERFLDAIISNIGWSHCCAVSSDSHSLGGEKLYLLVLNIGTVVVQRFYENYWWTYISTYLGK